MSRESCDFHKTAKFLTILSRGSGGAGYHSETVEYPKASFFFFGCALQLVGS